jgi:hypothetical protein
LVIPDPVEVEADAEADMEAEETMPAPAPVPELGVVLLDPVDSPTIAPTPVCQSLSSVLRKRAYPTAHPLHCSW